MNGGSSLPLALACWEAGVFPSLWSQIYNPAGVDFWNYDLLDYELGEFIKSTGSTNILVAVSVFWLENFKVLSILKSHKIKHVEIITEDLPRYHEFRDRLFFVKRLENNYDSILKAFLDYIQPTNVLIRIKSPTIHPVDNVAYGLKGSDSAGVNSEEFTTEELFYEQKKLTPAGILIPYGGIGTPTQVARYLNNGAEAVAVGTLFALSKESTISDAVKQKMISTTTKDIIKMPDTGQNSVIFGNMEQIDNDKLNFHDWNRTISLRKGLKGNANEGHVYMGASIDYVNEIKTVKNIVEYLTSEII